MKRLFALLAAGCVALALVGCGQSQSQSQVQSSSSGTASSGADSSETTSSSDAASSELLSGVYEAEITVKDYGTITVELDADTAPITVTNFVQLARDGFTMVLPSTASLTAL